MNSGFCRKSYCDLQLRGQFGHRTQFPIISNMLETKIFAKITFYMYFTKKEKMESKMAKCKRAKW